MGIKYMNLVRESDLDRAQKFVLLIIADYVNDEGEGCWASYDNLARLTGYDERQVIRIVNKLKESGILVHQGHHYKFGTNIWNIDKTKLNPLPNLREWRILQRTKEQTPAQNVTPPEDESEGDEMSPPSYDILSKGGDILVSETAKNDAKMSPNPEEEDSLGRTSVHTAFGDFLGGDAIPVNERADIDGSVQYVSVDEEDDPKAAARAQTPLERKIVQSCNPGTKYLSESMRNRLRSRRRYAIDGQPERIYPSPEEYCTQYPAEFMAYVEERTRKLRNQNSDRPPSRNALIDSIVNYDRPGTGWFAYLKKQQRKVAPEAQINANPLAVKRLDRKSRWE